MDSLKTPDFTEAKRKCLELTLEHDKAIQQFRTPTQEVNESSGGDMPDEYLESLAQAWASDWLHQDKQRRIRRLGQPDQIFLLGLSHTPTSLRKLLERENSKNWEGITLEVTKEWLK